MKPIVQSSKRLSEVVKQRMKKENTEVKRDLNKDETLAAEVFILLEDVAKTCDNSPTGDNVFENKLLGKE